MSLNEEYFLTITLTWLMDFLPLKSSPHPIGAISRVATATKNLDGFSCVRRPEYRLSAEGCRVQLERWRDGPVDWRQVFVERYKLRRSWMGGQCHVRTFEGHTGGISCVQFDGGRIVSGSHDKTIKVWNVKTNSPWSVITLAGHSGEVRCLHLGKGWKYTFLIFLMNN